MAFPSVFGEVKEQVELIGVLTIPGDARDLSSLTDVLEGGVPHNQLGGFSAMAWTGNGNRYLFLPDRGPSDGAVPYRCRVQEARVAVDPSAAVPLSFELLSTRMLTDERGRPFDGSSANIDVEHPDRSLRFDPEGIRMAASGMLYIADEYGPHLFAFSAEGRLVQRYPVPDHLTVRIPGPGSEEEHAANRTGRQTNRGFEGLALSADEQTLYAILQGPLLQDQPFDEHGNRLGRNVRLVEFPVDGGHTREFVYVLEHPSHGISEILQLDDRRFLVLERDNKGGDDARVKRLYEADLTAATDITGISSLPADQLPAEIRPLKKRLFLDLLDPQFGLAADQIPAKVEGICFGPDLADGRRLLLFCTDNDFVTADSSLIYAFAITEEPAEPHRP